MATSAIEERSLLSRIREATRDQHERLERELRFPEPDLTVDRYRAVLGRFYGYYAPWELKLEPWIAQLRPRGVNLHSKLSDLEADLDYFAVDRSALQLCHRKINCESLPAAVGSLYVREGSALGGQYISRQLETLLGLSDRQGYQFFSSAGRNVGREWKAFQSVLLQYSSRETEDEMIASAIETFENIRIWLCEA